MESITHVFEKASWMKQEGFTTEEIIDYLHREGHGFGVAVRVMEKNFSLSRPEAEAAVVKFPQYAEFAPILDEEDPTENLDYTIEF